MAQYYEVEDVQETKLDDFKGSTWYSVKFRGVADNALWLAQKRPDANAKVYGHIERTSSGKGWRFKRDPIPEDGAPEPAPEQGRAASVTTPVATGCSHKEQLDRIENKLDQLMGTVTPEEAHATDQAKRDAQTINEPLPEPPGDYGDEEGGY